MAVLLKGWALAKTGEAKVGVGMVREGIDRWKSTGAGMGLSTFLALQADALRTAGQIDAGLHAIEEGLGISALHGEVYYNAELHRIKGELLLNRKSKNGHGEIEKAETCFLHAVKTARKQGTKSLELRATLNLARLWQQRGESHRSA